MTLLMVVTVIYVTKVVAKEKTKRSGFNWIQTSDLYNTCTGLLPTEQWGYNWESSSLRALWQYEDHCSNMQLYQVRCSTNKILFFVCFICLKSATKRWTWRNLGYWESYLKTTMLTQGLFQRNLMSSLWLLEFHCINSLE